jgi:hypothetical protein
MLLLGLAWWRLSAAVVVAVHRAAGMVIVKLCKGETDEMKLTRTARK